MYRLFVMTKEFDTKEERAAIKEVVKLLKNN